MNVLLVNDYVRAGGCEVLVETIRAGLAARGHTVARFTAGDVPGHHRTPLAYVDSRRGRRALEAALRRRAPEVVHLHNFYHELSPGILAPLRRWKDTPARRVVMTVHDLHVVCPNSGGRYFRRGTALVATPEDARRPGRLLRRRWDHRGPGPSALKLAQHLWNYRLHHRHRAVDRFICPSRFVRSRLEDWSLPTAWLPNPAPAPAPGPPPARPRGPLHLVVAGRLEPEKGVAEFLGDLPPAFPGQVTVIGDGSALAACRAAAAGCPFERPVEFTGRLAHVETLARLARAHVVALPSRWPENAPLILLEALACGANVLVGSLGGASEIVEDSGIGFVYDVTDPSSLHRALERILREHYAGQLNRFDAGPFLRQRGEAAFFERLLAIYDPGPGP